MVVWLRCDTHFEHRLYNADDSEEEETSQASTEDDVLADRVADSRVTVQGHSLPSDKAQEGQDYDEPATEETSPAVMLQNAFNAHYWAGYWAALSFMHVSKQEEEGADGS
jgi:hypothetical protein